MSNIIKNTFNFIKSVWGREEKNMIDSASGAFTGALSAVDAFGSFVNNFGYDALQDHMKLETDLISRYIDYASMVSYPDISNALDIYADDSTIVDPYRKRTMWIECTDDDIQKDLEDVFYNRIRIEDQMWEIAHELCFMGNDFEEILVNENGVQGLNFLPPTTVRRVEGKKGENKGFVQSFRGNFDGVDPQQVEKWDFDKGVSVDETSGLALFEDWRVVHMRLRSKSRRSLYGQSILEPSRWIYKRLVLLEDSAFIYRLTRSPQRMGVYVDVGNLSPKDAEKSLALVKQSLKKRKMVNPQTGKLDFRFNPLSVDEDYFLPIRNGQEKIRIDTINNPSWQSVEDIEYFLKKMYAALGVPRAYAGYDENMPSRATLSQQDARFGRRVLRIQRELKNGMHKIGRVHLALRNIDPAYVDFKVGMTVPSAVFELAQLEVEQARASFAQMMETYVSEYFILSKIFNMSDEDIHKIEKQKREDKLKGAAVEGMSEKLRSGDEDADKYIGGKKKKQAPKEDRRQLKTSRHDTMSPEQRLLTGNRDHEKRAEDAFESMMKNNRDFARFINEARGLFNDLKANMK
jgi:hypothetical protein